MPEISILIPCLNEAQHLPELIERIHKIIFGSRISVETIILDDASDDDTIGVAKKLQELYKPLNIRIIHRFEPRKGYGALLRFGFACATGNYCLTVAADGAHPIEMIPSYIKAARNGAQLVQCSRYEKKEDNENIPKMFRCYQNIYRFFVRVFLRWDIRDSTCSFKLVDRIYMLSLGMRSSGLSIIPEIVFKIFLSGGKVEFIAGSQSFRERGISQWVFMREVSGYGYILLRAWLHRVGIPWF